MITLTDLVRPAPSFAGTFPCGGLISIVGLKPTPAKLKPRITHYKLAGFYFGSRRFPKPTTLIRPPQVVGQFTGTGYYYLMYSDTRHPALRR